MKPLLRHRPATPPLFSNGPIAMAPQGTGQLSAEEGRPATNEQPPPLREATTLPPEAIEPIKEPEIVRPVAVEEVPPVEIPPPRRPGRRWYICYLIVCFFAAVLLAIYLFHIPEAR